MGDNASGLQWESDRAFQERNWTLTRIGWAIMVLIVIAALAGLTGSRGPLAAGTVEAAGATITYPRISRWQTADSMTIEFSPDARGTAEVLLPLSFTEIFTVESVLPQPASVTATSKGQLFAFDLGPESGRKQASFSLRPERPAWPTNARVEIGERVMDLSITVLP